MKFDIRTLNEKWFAESTPQNFKGATAEIGSGTNGKVTISASNVKTTDVVSVVVATDANANLSVAYANGKLTITLGTGATGGIADSAKNTAALIATAIKSVDGFTATASGTGASSITTATSSDVAFTDGQAGTPCAEKYVGFVNGTTYYVCIKADNTIKNDGWRSFSLSSY